MSATAELYLKVKSVKCTRPTDRPFSSPNSKAAHLAGGQVQTSAFAMRLGRKTCQSSLRGNKQWARANSDLWSRFKITSLLTIVIQICNPAALQYQRCGPKPALSLYSKSDWLKTESSCHCRGKRHATRKLSMTKMELKEVTVTKALLSFP